MTTPQNPPATIRAHSAVLAIVERMEARNAQARPLAAPMVSQALRILEAQGPKAKAVAQARLDGIIAAADALDMLSGFTPSWAYTAIWSTAPAGPTPAAHSAGRMAFHVEWTGRLAAALGWSE